MSQNPLYLRGRVNYLARNPPEELNLAYFGYGDIRSYNKQSLPPSDLTALCETFPELLKYTLAPQDAQSALKALRNITAAMRNETDESEFFLTQANKIIVATTPASDRPCWFSTGIPNIDDVLNVISSLDRSKHPGFPACNLGSTKGEIIDNYIVDLIHAVGARLIALRYIAPYCETPYDFYSTFCSDAYCVAVKKEPIKLGKDGRIICSASIVTQIVEKLLYSEFDVAFKDGCYKTYSAIGIGFTSVDTVLLHAGLTHDPVCSDVPKFDSTVTLHEALLNVKVATKAYGGFAAPVEPLMVGLERAHFTKMFILPDGNVYYQSTTGYQPSGRDETSNFNTITRARRAYASALVINSVFLEKFETLPKCAGDDCIETYHPKLQQAYDYLGLPLRDVERFRIVQFCSHEWPTSGRPIGTRLYKSLFSLILYEPIPEASALSFITEYSNHAEFSDCMTLLSVHRPEMYTHIQSMLQKPIEVIPLYLPFAKPKKAKPATKPKVLANNASPRPIRPKKNKSKAKSQKAGRKPKSHHVRAVCSITDPFCQAAKSAKWPDGTSGNTLTEQFRGNVTVNTFATGNTCVCFGAAAPFGWLVPLSATGSAVTMDNSYTTYKSSSLLATYGDKYRIVSFGCIIRCVASATTASGIITLGTAPAVGQSQVVTLGSELYSEVVIKAIQPGMEISWVSQPMGSSAHTFVSQSTGTTVIDFDSWSSLVIELTGCPASSAMVNIEWYMNVEFLPKPQSTSYNNPLTALAKPNPPKVSAATDSSYIARGTLGSFIEGGIAQVEAAVAKHASSALESFLSDPLESVAMLFA